MGGTRPAALNQVPQSILRDGELHSILLLLQFISGALNVKADALSRQNQNQILGSEWTLCQQVVDDLLHQWPAMVFCLPPT